MGIRALTVALLAAATLPAQVTPKYTVQLSFDLPLHAKVSIALPIPNGELHVDQGGWEAEIRNLHAVNASGKQLAIQSGAPGRWKVTGPNSDYANISYDVDLSFAEQKRSLSDLRTGKFFGDSLFLVNRALFVMNDDAGPRDVEFIVPADWQIATPLEAVSERQFRARDNRQLSVNSAVYGKLATVHVNDGAFDLTLALPGDMAPARDLIAPVMPKVLRAYLDLFPQTPPRKSVLTFFYGADENGESYLNSGAFTTTDPVTPNGLIIWGNFLAHELFHQWNGQMIRGVVEADRQWFAEGFTEYIANRTLVRAGLISDDLFIKKMERHIGMYVYWDWAPPFDGTTIKDAGAKKSYNRPGVYSGGWTAAFCLDTMIRRESGNRKNLDDLMRVMFARFGLTGKQFQFEDIPAAATEAVGQDMSPFFAKYIAGRETLPVREALADAGFEGYVKSYAGEVYIFPMAAPEPSQQAIRDGILHNR